MRMKVRKRLREVRMRVRKSDVSEGRGVLERSLDVRMRVRETVTRVREVYKKEVWRGDNEGEGEDESEGKKKV